MPKVNNADSSVLAIIGGGPTCTYAVERLAANFNHYRNELRACTIYIFDKTGYFGAGEVHSPAQPKTSFLNRIAGQVCFAADESNIHAGPLLQLSFRPTLHQWCQRKYRETGDKTYNIGAQDWPQRALHGEALTECFNRYIELLKGLENVTVHLIKDEVVDIQKAANTYLVESTRNGTIRCDHILLATGHSSNRPELSSSINKLVSHANKHKDLRFVNYAYPLDQKLHNIDASKTVAVQGLGLTAIDVFLYLTEGRGGRFVTNERNECVYIPSGQEPRLVGFSRSGLFTTTRPHNEKEKDIENLEHKGEFLTSHSVDLLRQHRGFGRQNKLDFELHLWPIIRLEQAHLYYKTLFGKEFSGFLTSRLQNHFERFLNGDAKFSNCSEQAIAFFESYIDDEVGQLMTIIEVVLGKQYTEQSTYPDPIVQSAIIYYFKFFSGIDFSEELSQYEIGSEIYSIVYQQLNSPWDHSRCVTEHKYSWENVYQPIRGVPAGKEYTKALVRFMEEDNKFARQNNLRNPVKALCDGVWRDLRQVLAYAIDDGGLTPESHEIFLSKYMRIHNRLGNGAGTEVMEKMLALIKAGIIDVSIGSHPEITLEEEKGSFSLKSNDGTVRIDVDILVNAKIHEFHATADVMPLYRNMQKRGLIQQWENKYELTPSFRPGGIRLTEQFHPQNEHEQVETGITLLGPPTEGKYFFQIGAARPAQNHHILNDAINWANGFIDNLRITPCTGISETGAVEVAKLR